MTAHGLLLISVALCAIFTVFATARLTAVIFATPIDVWTEDYPPLFDAALRIDPGTQRRARWLSSIISDAGLIRAMQSVCFADSTAEGGGQANDGADCLAAIDVALGAAPASGELWFFKASKLVAAGGFGEEMINAFRNSYRTAPIEGWIASGRVILGLRLFPALASDLQEDVRSDLRLVLNDQRLSQPLVEAYVGDSSLRAAAVAPLQALPADAMQHFVARVRAAVRDR